MNIRFRSAVLFVQDIITSRRFYTEVLQQEVELDHQVHVVFRGGLSLWQAEEAVEEIYGSGAHVALTEHREASAAHFETDDLERTLARVKGVDVPVLHDVRELPWGQRAFWITDPDEHIIEIAESMYGLVHRLLAEPMTFEAIAKRTSLPLAYVRKVAKHEVSD